jgi:hypothetical protein
MTEKSATDASDDVADGSLIDVRSLSLSGLLAEPDQSSLTRALERILASSEESIPQNGWQSYI